MSNNIVATVYGHIIKDVMNNVQKDFEDNGIDLSVLQELEKLWESKVASSHVANFEAFTPQVIAPPPPPPTATREDYAKYYDQYSNQDSVYAPVSLPPVNYNQIPDLLPNPESYSAASLANLANPGSAPISSIQNMNQRMPQDMYQPRTSLPPYPVNMSEFSNYNQDPNQMLPSGFVGSDFKFNPDLSQNGNNGGHRPNQLDGADDEEPQPSSFKKLGHEESQPSSSKDAVKLTTEEADQWLNKKILLNHNEKITQLDGEDDDDVDLKIDPDVDDDAINSDLDDTDEGEAEDGEKDGAEHIILCQYDKVNRTKNRWRCNLKDGIILVNGKDYLFNKATGEFQW